MNARRLAVLAAAMVSLAGCGMIDRIGLFGSDNKQARSGSSRDAVPLGMLVGTVEADTPSASGNQRVELYEITGVDADEAVRKGNPAMVVRSARDGRFAFNLGGLARAPAGQSKAWLVRAGGDNPNGPEARVTFASAAARGRLPPLYLSEGKARADLGDQQVVFRFAGLPNAQRMDPPVYGVELASSTGGGAFMPFVSGSPEITLPRLALQELSWTYRPQASVEQRQPDGTVFHAVYRGAAHPIAAGGPPPLTRQREARLVPPGLGFRGLTDGKPDNMLPHQVPPGGIVEIDLGTAAEVGTIYLFGLAVEGAEELSVHLGPAPGARGPALATVQARDAFEIRLPAGSRGKFLAVRFAGRLVALSEFVAYPPVEAQKWEAARPQAPFSNRVDSQPVN